MSQCLNVSMFEPVSVWNGKSYAPSAFFTFFFSQFFYLKIGFNFQTDFLQKMSLDRILERRRSSQVKTKMTMWVHSIIWQLLHLFVCLFAAFVCLCCVHCLGLIHWWYFSYLEQLLWNCGAGLSEKKKQARKARRCDSNLQSETINDWPTDPLTHSLTGVKSNLLSSSKPSEFC